MVEIFKASNENLDQLTELALALWSNNEKQDLIKSDLIYIIGHLSNRVLLAKSDEDYIGFIHMSIRNGFVEGADTSPVGYVEGIYVKPDFRRKGVAKELYHAGLEWLRSKKCTQIGADIGIDSNMCPDFYLDIGFKEANRIICYINNI
ncbi:MAG: GNAT family N-acetyltransferase [Tissierellaceae bacterium]|nr:GNAT family N-acetyltransferase [Tissierellaceae bacterium]